MKLFLWLKNFRFFFLDARLVDFLLISHGIPHILFLVETSNHWLAKWHFFQVNRLLEGTFLFINLSLVKCSGFRQLHFLFMIFLPYPEYFFIFFFLPHHELFLFILLMLYVVIPTNCLSKHLSNLMPMFSQLANTRHTLVSIEFGTTDGLSLFIRAGGYRFLICLTLVTLPQIVVILISKMQPLGDNFIVAGAFHQRKSSFEKCSVTLHSFCSLLIIF